MRDQDIESLLPDRVKLNIDVACFKDESGRLGFIIHNSQGQVLMSTCKRIIVLNSPPEKEALAFIFGL